MHQHIHTRPTRPAAWWVTSGLLLAVAGLALLAGLVFGFGTGGIEPDGLFVRCGPGWIGRNDSEWDPRCLPQMNQDRTKSIIAFSIALVVLAVVAVRFLKRRTSSRNAQPLNR